MVVNLFQLFRNFMVIKSQRMKKVLTAIIPVIAIFVVSFTIKSKSAVKNEPLAIGSELPKADLKMTDISGKKVSFADAMKENGLLVMFSCNTCPVVHTYQSRINEICQYAMENGFGVILLNPNEAYRDNGDSYEDMKAYAGKEKFGWYYVVDENSVMADAFGANRTPESFLFNKDKKLVYHGAIDNSRNAGNVTEKYLKNAIDETKAGKKVSKEFSTSVGCTIKRVK